jgi:4-amino-4-deoxy-L-arabinose transferase-like glycosyltransferase
MQRVLSFLLLAFLALAVRLLWLGMVPMAEAPDEVTHLWILRFISTNMRLPSGQEVLVAGPVAVYGSIPQLGYIPHLVALKVLPTFTEIIAARVGSLFMAIITVLLARSVAVRIFAGRPLLEWSLPLMLVFHPQLVFVGAYTNNDVTTCALSSAILLLLLDSLSSGLKYWRSLAIGVLTGWLALTKYSGYAIIPCVAIFLVVSGFLHRARLKQIFLHLIMVFGVAAGLSAWWFVRNSYEFHGDITGSRTMFQTWTDTYHRRVDAAGSPFRVLTQSRWWRMNFWSFWGWFGYMTRSLPRVIYYVYMGFVSLAFLGGARALYFMQTGRTSDTLSFAENPDDFGDERVKTAMWCLMWVCALINFAADVYGTASGVSGPQGRYFFSSEIPLLALMLSGLYNLPGRIIGKVAVVALVVYTIVCYLYATSFLYSLYGFSIFAPQ